MKRSLYVYIFAAIMSGTTFFVQGVQKNVGAQPGVQEAVVNLLDSLKLAAEKPGVGGAVQGRVVGMLNNMAQGANNAQQLLANGLNNNDPNVPNPLAAGMGNITNAMKAVSAGLPMNNGKVEVAMSLSPDFANQLATAMENGLGAGFGKAMQNVEVNKGIKNLEKQASENFKDAVHNGAKNFGNEINEMVPGIRNFRKKLGGEMEGVGKNY